MQYHLLIFSLLLGSLLASAATVLNPVPTSPENLSLSKRGDPPPECKIKFHRFSIYRWIQIKPQKGGGNACLGYEAHATYLCKKPWSKSDVADIEKAVAQQVTKDGHFKKTVVGNWTAAFYLGTTAFANRDTSDFERVLDDEMAGGRESARSLKYHWARDGDYLFVKRKACPA